MFSDYRAFGECKKVVLTGPKTGIGDPGDTLLPHSFIHVIALGNADVVLADVIFTFDAGPDMNGVSTNSDTTVTIPPGGQLAGVKSCTLSTGQAQFLYFI